MECSTGASCRHELLSQHYEATGPGLILSCEEVILVVFDLSMKTGDKLTAEHFPTKKLGRGEISLARKKYATLDVLNDFVIKGKPVAGATTSTVKSIRAIGRKSDNAKVHELVRTVCVIDKVESGEHDSHASLRACEDQAAMSEPRRHKVRSALAADLARLFGSVQDIAAVFDSPLPNGPAPEFPETP
jgi:hypothetical protein